MLIPLNRFLYTKVLCLDACFRLKRRQISNWERDPALTDGRSYLVESGPFEAHIKQEGKDQQEVRGAGWLYEAKLTFGF